MEKKPDLQKEIERYREEMLQLAARRQPQPSKPQEDLPAAEEEPPASEAASVREESLRSDILEEASEQQKAPASSAEQQRKAQEVKAPEAAEQAAGILQVQVITARGLRPVKDAFVTISRVEAEMETLLHILHTDENGHTPDCTIPITSGEGQEGEAPCAYCHIRVDKPGFFACHAYRVPVYEAQTFLQSARLIPLPGHFPAAQETKEEERCAQQD